MTSSLDWAGLVPAVAAAAHVAAVMVQEYWDRRRRGARTTERDGCRHVPDRSKPFVPETRVIDVRVCVAAPAGTPVTLVVIAAGGSDGADALSLSVKGYHLW
ncbi:hypothetical protein ACFWII_37275 [Streptomyces sp. NPDC127063]|uniref:hypothetical protein n=1 Tax=Streptomyces sp. NPDC127063 TaxID=3347123 RepID=UPI00364EC88A